VRRAIRAVGARLLFLPPYTPTSIRPSRSSPNSKRCFARLMSVRPKPSAAHRILARGVLARRMRQLNRL
jgi:hypothetical protein